MRSPRAALPGSAMARCGKAVTTGIAIKRSRMRFIVGLHRLGAPQLQASVFARAIGSRATVTSSEKCQIRGGRKGGLLVCAENGLVANDGVILAKAAANTMIDDDVPAKLKHLSAQVAMAPQ